MIPALSKSIKIAVLAATIAVAGTALPGATAPAEAKKIVIVKHGHHHYRHAYFYRPAVVYSYAYTSGYSCYWLKERALETGRSYWWDRYRACRGYW
jgi:hypothetical protein